MTTLLQSPHIVDVILLVLGAEILALAGLGNRGRFSQRLSAAISAMAPGFFLLLALRAALSGAGWTPILLCLALSFPAHLLDLWRRPPQGVDDQDTSQRQRAPE
jgi:hypothetical protein